MHVIQITITCNLETLLDPPWPPSRDTLLPPGAALEASSCRWPRRTCRWCLICVPLPHSRCNHLPRGRSPRTGRRWSHRSVEARDWLNKIKHYNTELKPTKPFWFDRWKMYTWSPFSVLHWIYLYVVEEDVAASASRDDDLVALDDSAGVTVRVNGHVCLQTWPLLGRHFIKVDPVWRTFSQKNVPVCQHGLTSNAWVKRKWAKVAESFAVLCILHSVQIFYISDMQCRGNMQSISIKRFAHSKFLKKSKYMYSIYACRKNHLHNLSLQRQQSPVHP